MEITAVIQETSGLSVVKFGLRELLNRIDDVKLAVLQDIEADCVVNRSTKKYFERFEIFHDDICLYYPETIKIVDPPQKGSEGSAATYYVWDENTGILFQRIPPYSSTSCNYHRKGSEIFYNIKGNCRVCICSLKDKSYEGDKILTNESFTINPYYCHKLHALHDTVYNIILMPPGTGRTDHHYPERCIKELYFFTSPSIYKSLC